MTRYDNPPYSCTRVLAFHGAGSKTDCLPPELCMMVVRPPSSGKPCCHQVSLPITTGKLPVARPRAISAATIGEGHSPNGTAGSWDSALTCSSASTSAGEPVDSIPLSVIAIWCPIGLWPEAANTGHCRGFLAPASWRPYWHCVFLAPGFSALAVTPGVVEASNLVAWPAPPREASRSAPTGAR